MSPVVHTRGGRCEERRSRPGHLLTRMPGVPRVGCCFGPPFPQRSGARGRGALRRFILGARQRGQEHGVFGGSMPGRGGGAIPPRLLWPPRRLPSICPVGACPALHRGRVSVHNRRRPCQQPVCATGNRGVFARSRGLVLRLDPVWPPVRGPVSVPPVPPRRGFPLPPCRGHVAAPSGGCRVVAPPALAAATAARPIPLGRAPTMVRAPAARPRPASSQGSNLCEGSWEVHVEPRPAGATRPKARPARTPRPQVLGTAF